MILLIVPLIFDATIRASNKVDCIICTCTFILVVTITSISLVLILLYQLGMVALE